MQTFALRLTMTLTALTVAGEGQAQFRVANWEQDRWIRSDKLVHSGGSFVATEFARHLLSPKASVPVMLAAGLLWEIKDGYVPYEKYGFWGGEGFSTKDLIADAAGIGLNALLHEAIAAGGQRHGLRAKMRQTKKQLQPYRAVIHSH